MDPMRRHTFRTLAIILTVWSAAGTMGSTVPGRGKAPAAGPNLLLITVDTLRPDRLSCYGSRHLRTPAMDGLAARGSLFERAFAHDPITLPSHANILLGLTPLAHGVSENSKSRVDSRFLTLAEHLKSAGYATGAFIGAFPLDSRFGLDQGFDVYADAIPSRSSGYGVFPELPAEEVVGRTTGWLAKQTSKWFCWIHLWDPHAPYAPPEPYQSRYAQDPYTGEVAYVDAQLGRLFDEIRKRGGWDRTAVILTADHGEALGEHGEKTHSFFAYNSTIHVPLLIAGPGVRSARIRDNVSHIDIFPTACELLGVPLPTPLHGESLVPLMRGAKRPARPIYFESLEPYFNKGCAPLRGIIDDGKKYIDSPLPELYDLTEDFGEQKNLSGKTEGAPLAKALAEMRARGTIAPSPGDRASADPETLARLRSLGYIATRSSEIKSAYGPEDDVKTFLPFQQRMEEAILLSDEGKIDACIEVLERLVDEKPNLIAAYTFLSSLYLGREQIVEAVRLMERAIQSNPRNFSLLSEYGDMLVNAKQYIRAEEILSRALAMIDFDPVVWDNLGIVQLRNNKLDKADEYFHRAVALDPGFAFAWVNLGAVAMAAYEKGGKNERLTEAIGHLKKASELDPNMILALRGLGTAYWEAGKLDEAAAAWEKAVVVNPSDDYSTLNLGKAYLSLGDKYRAGNCFRRYIQIKGEAITPAELETVNALLEKCK
jgi:arylsulfatase A-like enzyme/Tfp pilus assembly protein PilF